ncbi:RNA polymerase sigma factor [Portibacter lacus]|uniref:DNA-directed RNA polymerase sigma-70 factor n=1 Tax=Portibacter lacus TaxID=1099794 RepID=A0AA37SSX6_9BACT|nr:sigma-70 family RNA polymerase sigma factor [Portibacter lacus]GLR17465.1 DNA-directed RNA polymerase sigma-70 factor [Portibacter lacus]
MATQNREQFLKVIEDHKGIIYKIATSYCKNAEDQKDLVQEITLQLWLSFHKYDPKYKYSTWIYRIALNVSISFYRKNRKRNERTEDLSTIIETSSEGINVFQQDSNLLLLQQFIKELREIDRALILLHLDGLSHKEISNIMGITPTNISTKINRIKTILKDKFQATKK